jgi:cytochrome c-type biogenesis protein CcsB
LTLTTSLPPLGLFSWLIGLFVVDPVLLYLSLRMLADGHAVSANPGPTRGAPEPAFLPRTSQFEWFNYQFVLFGFLWLSVGIITGSIWANSAWGSYWSWDPKETWSLITWFIYAALLHARNLQGWKGERVTWLSMIGFVSVLFTYFGVNLLLSGLHSYAR